MNAQIQSQFDRLDSALDTLVDSITSYNPSPTAASTLVQIDRDLTADLDTHPPKTIVAQHQRNTQTLSSLRTTTANLDARIRDTIALLASTRKELIAAGPPAPSSSTSMTTRNPSSSSSNSTAPDYSSSNNTPAKKATDASTLLQTAQRIAKSTRPPVPSYHPTLTSSSSIPPAQATPRASPHPPLHQQPAEPTTTNTAPKKPDLAPSLLSAQQLSDLDPFVAGAQSFVPWPSEQQIRAGELGRLQGILEGGGDVDREIQAQGGKGGVGDGNGVEGEVEDGEAGQTALVNGVGVGAGATRKEMSSEEVERRRREQEERRRMQEAELAGFELYDPDAE